ncbi:MAG: hypothetical protein K1X79_11460 [Oligoflexia bacterium]|nr:hypothetical protein [Oligoflexia bacterium]
MAVLKRKSNTRILQRDPEKERKFKKLSELLSAGGYTVRREKLKQGHGWKVVSGACTALGQRLVFVDQRMSQDDQLAFLRNIAQTAGIQLPETETSPQDSAESKAA